MDETDWRMDMIEVDRAMDNLVKSGKMFPQQRRESMPVITPRAFPVEHGKYFQVYSRVSYGKLSNHG